MEDTYVINRKIHIVKSKEDKTSDYCDDDEEESNDEGNEKH